MQKDSSFSRAGQPYEVGDISDEEAIRYLLSKNADLSRDRVTDAVLTITGGRFELLTTFEKNYKKDSNDEIRKQLYGELDRKLFGNSSILDEDHEFFKLLLQGPVAIRAALRTGVTNKQLDQLTKANVVSFHRKQTYTVHSRYIAHYFKDKPVVEPKSE